MVRVGVRFLRIVASVQSRTRSTYESPYSLVWLSGQLVVPEWSKLCACSGPGPARAIRPFQPMNWLETPVNLIPSCSVEISGSFHHKSTRRIDKKKVHKEKNAKQKDVDAQSSYVLNMFRPQSTTRAVFICVNNTRTVDKEW